MDEEVRGRSHRTDHCDSHTSHRCPSAALGPASAQLTAGNITGGPDITPGSAGGSFGTAGPGPKSAARSMLMAASERPTLVAAGELRNPQFLDADATKRNASATRGDI